MACPFTKAATKGLARLRVRTSVGRSKEVVKDVVERMSGISDPAERKAVQKLFNAAMKDVGEFQDAGIEGFDTLFEYLQSPPGGGASNGKYVIEVFREKALAGLADREMFCINVLDADDAGVEGLDVLLARINGVTSVQGTHYTMSVARLVSPALDGVAVEVDVAGSLTPLDIVLDDAVPASRLDPSAAGDVLAIECKFSTSPTPAPDIHSQGIDYLKHLVDEGEDPRLFRFVHNCGDDHVKNEATKFLQEIVTTANGQKGTFGKEAAAAVVKQLKKAGVAGIEAWDPATVVGQYSGLTAEEKQAADLVRQWFYVRHTVNWVP